MAVGFTPKYIEDFSVNDLTQQEFLVLANEAATKTGWEVSYLSDSGLIAHTNKGMFSWNAEVKIKTEYGIATIQSASTGSEMVDWGKNKKNVSKFLSNFEELKSTLTKEELDEEYQVLKEQLVPKEDDILVLPPRTTAEQFKDFFSLFVPKKGFFITPLLIDLNILIFILMAVSGVNVFLPDNESLLKWGANFQPMTLEGEWWRLITNCFLHIGIMHLLLNMYALLYIGLLLEPRLGKARFISAYLLAGITASVTSLYWHSFTISAGASGAIFGMYGVFFAMLTTNLIEKKARKALLVSILVFVGYNLINGLREGIDNAAHIGGFLGGLVIGYAYIPGLKRPDEAKLKFGIIGFLAVVLLGFTFVVYKRLPNNILIYEGKMKEFVSMESMALEVSSLPANTPKDKILYEIKDRGIYYWKENIKLLNDLDALDLPPELRNRNRILKEYCELRIKSYELIYKAISEDTDEHRAQVEDYSQQINAKINELTGGLPGNR